LLKVKKFSGIRIIERRERYENIDWAAISLGWKYPLLGWDLGGQKNLPDETRRG